MYNSIFHNFLPSICSTNYVTSLLTLLFRLRLATVNEETSAGNAEAIDLRNLRYGVMPIGITFPES